MVTAAPRGTLRFEQVERADGAVLERYERANAHEPRHARNARHAEHDVRGEHSEPCVGAALTVVVELLLVQEDLLVQSRWMRPYTERRVRYMPPRYPPEASTPWRSRAYVRHMASYTTDSMKGLAESRERHRRWLSIMHASNPVPEQPPRNPDLEAEQLARALADEALTDEARGWLDHRVRLLTKSRLLGALQLVAKEARGAVADYLAAIAITRRAGGEATTTLDLEVERAPDTCTALALAAEHLADNEYRDERIGR